MADHRRLRRAPNFVISQRVQNDYPELTCNLVERLFNVNNPRPRRAASPRLARGPAGQVRAATFVQTATDLRQGAPRRPMRTFVNGIGLRGPHGGRRVPGGGPGPHHRRRRRLPRLHHPGLRHRLPGQPVRAHRRRRILFNYEQCFECGTCYLVCNTGAITWTYPTAATASCSTEAERGRRRVCLKWVELRPRWIR